MGKRSKIIHSIAIIMMILGAIISTIHLKQENSDLLCNEQSNWPGDYSDHDNHEIVVDGNHLFLYQPTWGEVKIVIIDISNPSDLKTISEIRIDDYIGPQEGCIFLTRNRLLLCGSDFWVYDVSDVKEPFFLGKCEIISTPVCIDVADEYAYVGSKNGMNIIDISNENSPTHESFYEMNGTAIDIIASNMFVFLAENEEGIVVFNVSDPASPKRIINYDVGNSTIRDIALIGDVLFYINPNATALDIRDVYNPIEIWHSIRIYSIIIEDGDELFLYYGNIEVYDVENPMEVQKRGEIKDIWIQSNISIKGSYLYGLHMDIEIYKIKQFDLSSFLLGAVPIWVVTIIASLIIIKRFRSGKKSERREKHVNHTLSK